MPILQIFIFRILQVFINYSIFSSSFLHIRVESPLAHCSYAHVTVNPDHLPLESCPRSPAVLHVLQGLVLDASTLPLGVEGVAVVSPSIVLVSDLPHHESFRVELLEILVVVVDDIDPGAVGALRILVTPEVEEVSLPGVGPGAGQEGPHLVVLPAGVPHPELARLIVHLKHLAILHVDDVEGDVLQDAVLVVIAISPVVPGGHEGADEQVDAGLGASGDVAGPLVLVLDAHLAVVLHVHQARLILSLVSSGLPVNSSKSPWSKASGESSISSTHLHPQEDDGKSEDHHVDVSLQLCQDAVGLLVYPM